MLSLQSAQADLRGPMFSGFFYQLILGITFLIMSLSTLPNPV